MNQLLELVAALLVLASLRTVAARRLDDYVGGFVLQSLALAALATLTALATGAPDLYLLAALTLLVKVYLIPRILRRVADELPVERGVRSVMGHSTSIVVALALVLVAFLTAPRIGTASDAMSEPRIAVSVGMVLIGLLLLSTRRHAVAQLVGLLTVENGMFAGALAAAPGMPFIVEFGVLLDVLIAVAVIGLLVTLIQRELASIDTTELRRLRG